MSDSLKQPSTNAYPPQGSDSLRDFLLTQKSVSQKLSKEYGESVSSQIWRYIITGLQGYFYNRNARFVKNRNYANGRMNIQSMFQDRFKFNGKENYIALNWNALQLCNRIVSGLVGRWMKRGEKIQVKAIDDLSQTDKQDEYDQLEFIIENRQQLMALQEQSGVQIVPETVPEDKEQLHIWRAEMQRLPEEIVSEMVANDVFSSNGWYDVLKEKILHDAAETLFVGTYTYMDDNGVIHIEWLKPENCVYSYSDYPDFRDTSWRGYIRTRKISEFRRMYGKEFNPDNPYALSEEDLWRLSQKCKDFQYFTNLQWDNVWVTSYMRPYDEWNLRVLEFEIKSVDSEVITKTVTNLSGSTYLNRGMPKTRSGKPKEKSENQEIIPDTNWNIYRGVWIPDTDQLLEWKLKDNMIRPQDPKEIGNAEFSYSFYMPQNYAMRNLAIPEKIEAAIDGMILACLKVQQDISMAIPSGWVIDETAVQAIDYGLGDAGNKSVDHVKQFFQTGKLWYKGLDAEGNRVPVPIQEIANSGFLNHVQAFITTYQFWYQALKDELGEDPNLITAAVQPRVTAENVEASQQGSENATDYIYRAYIEVMKMTARKALCLAKDSVTYGASAYRHLAQKDDFDKRQFSTDIRFLPTEYEVQQFQAILNQTIATNQDIILFVDPFQLIRVAKEDVKLAEMLFRNAQKKMIMWQQQTAQQNQQQTIDGQIQSAQAAEQAKGQNQMDKLDAEAELAEKTGKVEKEKIALQGTFSLLNTLLAPQKTTGEGGRVSTPDIPPNVNELINLVIKNIAIPLAMDNAQMASGVQNETEQINQQNTQPPPQQAA